MKVVVRATVVATCLSRSSRPAAVGIGVIVMGDTGTVGVARTAASIVNEVFAFLGY